MKNKPSNETKIAGNADVKDGDFVAGNKVVQNVNLDIGKLASALKTVLPDGDLTPQYLLDTLRSFRRYHYELYEWKELHNSLNDVSVMFGPFASEIDRVEVAEEELSLRKLGSLWQPVSQRVNIMLEWGKGIKYIGEPFVRSKKNLQGPNWAIDIWIRVVPE